MEREMQTTDFHDEIKEDETGYHTISVLQDTRLEKNLLDFLRKVLQGIRPSIPELKCTTCTALCKLMKECWDNDSAVRPSYTDILIYLDTLTPC